MIELLNFRKKYHLETVLDIHDWHFDKGIYHLKGANGSGKSTLLQSMAARLSFEGDIRVNGKSVKRSPRECREKVSYAAAEPLFAEFLSGSDLYGFFLKTKGKPSWQLDELMGGFGVPEFLDSPTGTYSSGMLKKLALVLAFTGSPDWILLDEPYNGLDTRAVEVLSGFIRGLTDRFGVGFIIASHHEQDGLLAEGHKVVSVANSQLSFL